MGVGFGTTHTIASSFAALMLQSAYQLSAFLIRRFHQRIEPRRIKRKLLK
jgi:hypothetical protein